MANTKWWLIQKTKNKSGFAVKINSGQMSVNIINRILADILFSFVMKVGVKMMIKGTKS